MKILFLHQLQMLQNPFRQNLVECIESQKISDGNSIAQSSAVDALQVQHIHPWEGEPAKLNF